MVKEWNLFFFFSYLFLFFLISPEFSGGRITMVFSEKVNFQASSL
jgi:hypothetical protein